MTDLLDTPLDALFADRPLLARVVAAMQLDSGRPFMETMDDLHQGSDHAFSTGRPTLRRAVEWAGADPDFIASSVRLLERRDEVVARAYDSPAGPIMLDAAEVAVARADPDGRFNRMLRAGGAADRRQFEQADALYLGGGRDIVAEAERDRGQHQARAQADRLAKQLDQAIRNGADKRLALKQLEQDLTALEGRASGVGFDGARDQLRDRANTAGVEDARRLLDQFDSVSEAGTGGAAGVPTFDEVQARMKLLDRSQGQFAKTLEEMMAGDASPPVTPTQTDVPPGVHPGSHELAKRVRDRLKLLDRRDSEYQRTLIEVLNEEM